MTLILPLLFVACDTPPRPERVIALRWGGRVETTTDLSGLPSRDFTFAIRFFPVHRLAGEGPIIAASGKVPVSVGYADWLASEQPALLVRAANAWALYEDPGPGWHDLALTHTASSGSFVLYVDGERRCPINIAPEAAGDCELKQVLPGPVDGRLWLGRAPLQRGARVAQFYGFVDDFLVYNRALPAAEIPALRHGPTGSTPPPDYLVAYRFPAGTPDGSADGPSYAQHGTAAYFDLAIGRDESQDGTFYPSPPVRDWKLPFEPNRSWEVVRGWEDVAAGHVGPMAFLQDLAYRGEGDGVLIAPHELRVSALGTTDPRPYVCLERKREQHLCLRDVDLDAGLVEGSIVPAGTRLGVARRVDGVPTVQISGSDAPEPAVSTRLVTYPLAFTGIELSDDGVVWTPDEKGALLVGKRVRAR